MLNEVLVRKHDRTVKPIWKTSVASTNHHNADDDLAKRVECTAERHVHRWVAETQSNVGTVRRVSRPCPRYFRGLIDDLLCRSDLEEYGEQVVGLDGKFQQIGAHEDDN